MTDLPTLQSIDARTGLPSGEPWAASTPDQIAAAVNAAADAAVAWAASTGTARARLLRGLADALEANRERLVPLADRETALGMARLNGELDRTAFQLRGFADAAEQGAPFAVQDDPPVAGGPPAGRPRLTRVRVPLGPVAMFAASNFPFAFSVLGGDTASALAAGCPVVVKGHPAHPALSRQTVALARQVLARQQLPAGLIGFVEGAGVATGVQLVQADAIAAVAFTGSFAGGTALAKVAAERPRPIPFFGELGSINPVIVLPQALTGDATELAQTLAGSICQGSGQFCTSPGVIVVQKDAAGDAFVQALTTQLAGLSPHAMLTAGIRRAFDTGIARWRGTPGVRTLLADVAQADDTPRPCLAEVDAATFVADASLHEEVFGAAALVVRTGAPLQAIDVLRAVGGSLTVTLWGVDASANAPDPATLELVRTASQVAGRVLFDGVPTGVAVTAAQQHGGPFPASTAPATTSVGYAALDRFLRPVALQDAPAWLVERRGVPC
ncbi:NADP-dependent aldehyde dehydrogenase [Cupriavidus gilardii J11]|uniref:NADP-dependent aldehyde dehydrogenase n=1 Tax=Cupriavidus gilardii J11 TaxID=936133 RepID=A0A562B2B2_9BURK|nr:aldehyde dehydrogenase (NADP(+)) [Cupriavidus gilardii]TWG79040.1 NADP-dependent aldehyde dehydrogenase [Cupriavidus gilardii J11]